MYVGRLAPAPALFLNAISSLRRPQNSGLRAPCGARAEAGTIQVSRKRDNVFRKRRSGDRRILLTSRLVGENAFQVIVGDGLDQMVIKSGV
jgi:hypothetical protein